MARFPFYWLHNIPLYMYRLHFLYPFVHRWTLTLFMETTGLATVNNATTSRSRVFRSPDSSIFNFLRNYHCITPNSAQRFPSLHILAGMRTPASHGSSASSRHQSPSAADRRPAIWPHLQALLLPHFPWPRSSCLFPLLILLLASCDCRVTCLLSQYSLSAMWHLPESISSISAGLTPSTPTARGGVGPWVLPSQIPFSALLGCNIYWVVIQLP